VDFGSHVDGVVLATAGLVNVVCPGERQGRPYAVPDGAALGKALGAALRLASPDASDPITRRRPALLELGALVRPVFVMVDDGDDDAAAVRVNDLLARYRPTPALRRHDGQPWHLHFHGPEPTDPTGWGGAVSVAMATVLGSEYADRLGVCAAPSCDRVFVDVSRNGTKRFCTEACQSRVKAAAHRARQRG